MDFGGYILFGTVSTVWLMGILRCDYLGTKGTESAEKPFVWIFSTFSITVGSDWLGYVGRSAPSVVFKSRPQIP